MNTASDEGASKVARRENALAVKEDGTKDFLLGKLVGTGTNLLSHKLASDVQAIVVSEMRKIYGEENIKDLLRKAAAGAGVWRANASV